MFNIKPRLAKAVYATIKSKEILDREIISLNTFCCFLVVFLLMVHQFYFGSKIQKTVCSMRYIQSLNYTRKGFLKFCWSP